MKAVLLTGASGTVGSAVLRALLKRADYEVHAITRRPLADADRLVQHVLDLTTKNWVESMKHCEFDFIIDCSQRRYTEAISDQRVDFDISVLTGLSQLSTSRTKRRIYTSGVWVYGHQNGNEVIDENSPHRPIQHAVYRDRLLRELRSDRLGNWVELCLPSIVYGSVGPLVDIWRAVMRDACTIIDDASVKWSLIEREDLADAYVRLLESEYSDRLFLVAEERAVSIIEFHARIAEYVGRIIQPISYDRLAAVLSSEDLEVATANQPVDSSRIREAIGWKNRKNYSESVRDLIKMIESEYEP